MKLSEQHIFKGYWWLPNNPEKKVAGVLTYTPAEHILLELIGAFDSDEESLDFITGTKETVPLIYGIDSCAKEISLISCQRSYFYNFSSSFPIMHYFAQIAIIDKHVRSLDEIYPYTANIRIPELSYWAFPSAIERIFHYDSNSNEVKSSSITIPLFDSESSTIFSTECQNGVKLSINRSASYQEGELMLKPEFEQYSYLKICKPQKGISINEIFQEIYKFCQFLSLATKRIIHPESIYLTDPENRQDFKDGSKSIYFPIHILVKQTYPYKQPKINRDKFLFCYEDLKDKISVILHNWMSDSEELQPIKNHLVDSLVYKPVVGSVDYLQVMQAIEGVWWRFKDNEYKKRNHIKNKKQTPLNTILTEMVTSLSTIPSIAKMDIDISAAVDSRVYYTHFIDKSKRKIILDGWDLYEMTKKMRNILLCTVLELLGLSHDEIEQIISKSSY